MSVALLVLMAVVTHMQWRHNEIATQTRNTGATAAVPALGSMFDYRPTLLVVGDSFAGGVGDPTFQPYPYLLADRLGWNLAMDAQGGTGFVNVVAGQHSGRVPFGDRLARDGQIYNVDYVLIDGGRNDLGLPPPEVISAADKYMNEVRAIWPMAKIIVVLPSYISAEEASNYQQVSDGMRHSGEEIGAFIIDPVAEGWYRNRDLSQLLWRDNIHPNAMGNEYYADRIIDALRNLGLLK